MTKVDALDVFPIEYRHETVIKFIKDLMEGNIKLAQPLKPESAKSFADVYTDMSKDIEEFFSRQLKGEDIKISNLVCFK